MGRALLFCGAAWVTPSLVALVLTGVVAGATSSLSASAVGPFMLLAMVLQLTCYGLASLLFGLRLSRWVQGGGMVAVLLVHLCGQLAQAGLMAFGTLVAFNR